MATTISIHAFRRGTGKSSLAANLAALLAMQGQQVGLVDAALRSPGLHMFFRLNEGRIGRTLNDYVRGKCDIEQTAIDVTPAQHAPNGRLWFVPASSDLLEIAHLLRAGWNIEALASGFQTLNDALALDTLLVDTHTGLDEEMLSVLALADSLLILLRPDKQDYQGTAVLVEVARRLGIRNMALIINEVPPTIDLELIRTEVERTYGYPVVGVLPHTNELTILASNDLFVVRHPDHPLTTLLRQMVAVLRTQGLV